MRQTVEVIRLLGGGRCEVYVKRETSCGDACASCSGCGAAGASIANALNRANALPGDLAITEARRRDVFGIAALFYLLPVVLAVGLEVLFGTVLGWFAGVGFVLGLIAGMLPILLLGRATKRELLIVTRVVGRAGDSVSAD